MEVLVDGYQSKDGSNKANGRDVTFADGKKLFLGSSNTGASRRHAREIGAVMRTKTLLLIGAAGFMAALLPPLRSETPSAGGADRRREFRRRRPHGRRDGQRQEDGGTITITVASDQNGRYSFPRNRLEAGQYSLRIRAVGYELDDPGAVEYRRPPRLRSI